MGGKLNSLFFSAWEGKGVRRRMEERMAVERTGVMLSSLLAFMWVTRLVRCADGAKARDSGVRMATRTPTRAAVLDGMVGVVSLSGFYNR